MTNNTDPVRALDEGMVERAVAAVMSAPTGISVEAYVRIVLEAALAAAPPSGGGSSESDADLLARLGDDARKWAQEFRATAIKLGYSDMDEGWLIGWFANAIEHSSDVRRWRAEAAPPSAPVGMKWAEIVEGLRLADQFFDGDSSYWQWDDGEFFPADKVRIAYQAALAQQPAAPSGEAVATVIGHDLCSRVAVDWHRNDLPPGTKLYTAPQQPAGVDSEPDCPHSALDGCDCYAAQQQGGA